MERKNKVECVLEIKFDDSKNLVLCQREFFNFCQEIVIPQKSIPLFLSKLKDFKKQWDLEVSKKEEKTKLKFELELTDNTFIDFNEGMFNERNLTDDTISIYWNKGIIMFGIPIICIVLHCSIIDYLIDVILNRDYTEIPLII